MAICFTSLSRSDTYGWVTVDMKELKSDDSSGSGNNFMIIYGVTAGNTYYFGAKYYLYSSTGSFDVSLTEAPLWAHNSGELTRYYGNESAIAIPAELDGETITSIASWALSHCTSLTSVTIPAGVTSIGGDAFYGTSWYMNQPDGVVYAGKVAYCYKGDCPSAVVIKNGTLGIAEYAFSDCTGLKSVTIADSVTNIGADSFYGCTGLTSLTIGKGVTRIENEAFEGCTALTSVTIPNSVTDIGYRAFEGCTTLTSISIPDSVTSIGEGAFSRCWSLKSITIPDNVTSISGGAFSNCTGLTTVTIPDGVTSIGNGAFMGCTGLTSVTIGKGITWIGDEAFYDCPGLTSVMIQGSRSDTEIGMDAFGYYDYGYIKVDGFTIYGFAGSDAQRYAEENGFDFIEIHVESDVDQNTGIPSHNYRLPAAMHSPASDLPLVLFAIECCH